MDNWEDLRGEIYWTCKDKTKVLLKDMGDRHLNNCIAMVKRELYRYSDTIMSIYSYIGQAPDGAAYAAEQEANQITDKELAANIWLNTLQKERDYRDERTRI